MNSLKLHLISVIQFLLPLPTIRGKITKKVVVLDNTVSKDAVFVKCHIVYGGGNCTSTNCVFEDCTWELFGKAAAGAVLLDAVGRYNPLFVMKTLPQTTPVLLGLIELLRAQEKGEGE